MSKPAFGTALSTGSAYYAGMARAYGILNTSGTTIDDAKAGDTATLPGANAAIVANSGNPYLEFTAATNGAALATGITLPSIASGTPYAWSLAWGGLTTTSPVVLGALNGSAYFYKASGAQIYVHSAAFGDAIFSGLSLDSSYHDWFVTASWSGSAWTVKLYQDGTLVGTQTPAGVVGQPAFKLDHLGNGYPDSAIGLVGRIYYAYLWDGVAFTGTEVATFALNPYDPFTAAAAPTVTVDVTDGSVYGHYVRVEGEARLFANYGTSSWSTYGDETTYVYPDLGIRFRATCTQLDLHTYLNGCPVRLAVDGVDVASATLANTSSWGNTSGLFTGLDGANEHEYLISFGNNAFVDKVVITGSVNTAALAEHPVIACYGDSITLGHANTGNDATLSYAHKLGLLLGYQPVNRGIGSTYVTNQGPLSGSIRTGDVTGIGTTFSPASGPVPSVVLILYGVNDVDSGSITATAFGTAYSTMLAAIRAGLPGATIVCEAILRANTLADTFQDPFNAKIAEVVAAMSDPKIMYKHGGYDAYDPEVGGGIHPTGSGYTPIAAAFHADILAALTPSVNVRRSMNLSRTGSRQAI